MQGGSVGVWVKNNALMFSNIAKNAQNRVKVCKIRDFNA